MSYLQTSGTMFTVNGSRFVPCGGSVYDISNSTFQVDIKHLAALDMNLNIVRYVNWMSHSATANTEFTESLWTTVDYGLARAVTDNLYVLLDLSDFMGIATARGYTFGDANMLALYSSVLTFMLNRVNTVNGRVYKNDDRIGIVSIVGEAEGFSAQVGYDTFNTIGGYFKAIDTNHIIQAGGQKPEQIVDASYALGVHPPEDILSAPNIDCASTHPYYTQADMARLFPTLRDYSVKRNKPWFCEEFGYPQNAAAFGAGNDSARANALAYIYKTGFKYGSAAHLFWNIDTGGGGSYGINVNTPEARNIVRTFAKTTAYSPRLIVI